MQLPQIVEVKGIRVLTSKQLSEKYETTTNTIKVNFARNRERFIDGKHYISLTGDDLKAFKKQVTICNLVDGRTSHLYLWTEKGALLHAKSLNTDKAWEVYDYLVDFYFRAKEQIPVSQETKPAPVKKPASNPLTMKVVDVPENPKILGAIKKLQEDLICMNVFLERLKAYNSEKLYCDFRSSAIDVMRFIAEDANNLLDLKPNIIEKRY